MPLRTLENGDTVVLVSDRHGRAFLALLALEIILFTLLLGRVSTVATASLEILVPLAACLAVMAWTASYIAADTRLEVDRTARRASLVRIDPLTGHRSRTDFPIDTVAGLALRELPVTAKSRRRPPVYVVAVELRGGKRFVVSDSAPLLVLSDSIDHFAKAAGLGTRIERV